MRGDPKKIAGPLRLKGYNIDNNQAYQIIYEASLNHPLFSAKKNLGNQAFLA
ncbi:MAG: hypothetical protein WC046_09255 [Candidatus Bathyarchaeia archaeon]